MYPQEGTVGAHSRRHGIESDYDEVREVSPFYSVGGYLRIPWEKRGPDSIT